MPLITLFLPFLHILSTDTWSVLSSFFKKLLAIPIYLLKKNKMGLELPYIWYLTSKIPIV